MWHKSKCALGTPSGNLQYYNIIYKLIYKLNHNLSAHCVHVQYVYKHQGNHPIRPIHDQQEILATNALSILGSCFQSTSFRTLL